jgi:mevalonate kinase
MAKVIASAPGKCILFGEHAVVFGQPAVAVAIEQRISVSLELSDKKDDEWRIDGMKFIASKHPHVKALRSRMWQKSAGAPALSIQISGDIPPASGLGSSAALSVAASACLRAARGRWLSEGGNASEPKDWAEGFSSKIDDTDVYSDVTKGKDLARRAGNNGHRTSHVFGELAVDLDESALLGHAVEAIAQGGRASPMDSSTCAHGGFVLLSDNIENGADWEYTRKMSTPEGDRTWQVHTLPISVEDQDVYLVIGNSGVHAPTSQQVAKVAKAMSQEPQRMKEIETIGVIARRGIEALLKGDFEAVGRAMSENHLMLRGLGVSCQELENLIRAAAPTSLGVKLTGAGGGGCMVALTRNPKQTSEAIELAGGRTLISKLGNNGVRIDSDEGLPFWKPVA